MDSPFGKIYPEYNGLLQKLAVGLFILGILGMMNTEPDGSTERLYALLILIGSILMFFYGWFRDRADPNSRLCLSCNEVVKISDVMRTISFEVLGVTDTTQAVTTNNAVTGLTASGGQISPTVGNIQTTSYVPIKMGRIRISTSCPSCQNTFQWVEDRQVNQWTDSNGNFSYDVLGNTILP
tara:strand:- start:344 stop:886 length:543 start_codon:yes stop_codon:yes gene_type:complete